MDNYSIESDNDYKTSAEETPSLPKQEMPNVETVAPEDIEAIEQSNLPAEEKTKIKRMYEQAQFVAYELSGPFPHPSLIEGYEKIIPGAAERIFQFSEKEQNHRHMIQDERLRVASRDSLMGIITSTILACGALVAGVIIAVINPSTASSVVGALLGGSGIGIIAVAMITNTRIKCQSNEKTDRIDERKEAAITKKEEIEP